MKPKLLISINTLNYGGAERVVSQLVNHLGADYEIHLALFSKSICFFIPENIKILDLGQSATDGNMAILLKIPLLAKKVARYCKENDIGISVSFLNRPCYLNAFMRFLFNYKGKVVMCERSHQSSILNYIGGGSALYKIVTKKLIHFSYTQADLVLTNSEASRLDLINNFSIKTPIEVIYNPININEINIQSREPLQVGLDPNCFYFVTTGNFRVEKNFKLLIEAFSLLGDLNAKLILVGGGKEQADLEQLAKDKAVSDRVVFTGFDKNPFKYMSSSDCFVLSSFTEGFPNVLLEALACGLPIISTDCRSGPRELLAPTTDFSFEVKNNYEEAEYGLLTPVNDPIQLANAMSRMFTDGELRKKLRDKAKIRAFEFDIEVIKKIYSTAFRPSTKQS